MEKEFTLRVCGQTTHAIGTGGPQFLRYVIDLSNCDLIPIVLNFFYSVILKPEEFRLCGAFSHDIKFF